jgi:hypothetical protein
LLLGLAAPAWARFDWQLVDSSETEQVFIDRAGLERRGERIFFHERRVPRLKTFDVPSQRPVREVLLKRALNCSKQRVTTLSRAVFSEDDALIDHQATRLNEARWQGIAPDTAVFQLVCAKTKP